MSRGRDRVNRAEQVEHLRRQIAGISAKASESTGRRSPAATSLETVLPASEALLPLPESLAGQLGLALPRGSVAVLSGARSLMLQMVAATTAEGGHAALVGQPDVGLLAAAEMGADLTRIAVVPDPGADPVEVAAVLMDGMDLVVLGLRVRSVPPSRARAVTARARQKGCTLLVVGAAWPGAVAQFDARVRGYEIVGAGAGRPISGCGRIGRVRLDATARGKYVTGVRAVGE